MRGKGLGRAMPRAEHDRGGNEHGEQENLEPALLHCSLETTSSGRGQRQRLCRCLNSQKEGCWESLMGVSRGGLCRSIAFNEGERSASSCHGTTPLRPPFTEWGKRTVLRRPDTECIRLHPSDASTRPLSEGPLQNHVLWAWFFIGTYPASPFPRRRPQVPAGADRPARSARACPSGSAASPRSEATARRDLR